MNISLIKSIRGSNSFFTKNNIGSYMNVLGTNYKPVYIELKKKNILDIVI